MKKVFFITALLCLVLIGCCNQEDSDTRLFRAIYNNELDTVKKLIDESIDINAYNSEAGDPTLIYAILTGTDDMVKLLLDNGVEQNPEQPGEHWDNMTIPLAISLNKMDIVETLIKRKVGTDAKSIKDSTLLIHASCKGYTDIVKALIESGDIDINHKGRQATGEATALDEVKSHGREEVVKLLLDAGAED
jgi:ankyrin repeat protein